MTDTTQTIQAQDQKTPDKEQNFRALEQKYQRALEAERAARIEAERLVQESKRNNQSDEDDDDSEPYVDHKRLNKKLEKHGQSLQQQTQSDIKKAVNQAISEERQQNWIKQNPDFYNVLQHAEKFANHDPELAETILQMPEGFERQKLVYKSIKALGLHQEKAKEPSMQERIDANRRSPFQPNSGVGSAPYSSQGDFSSSGQKNAYDKMQELKNRLRL
jgi:hypothetical protein